MILIAHRGNVSGPDTSQENMPAYIDTAIAAGYDAEVDLWLVNNTFYLGHDEPQHEISLEWLLNRCDRLWIHAKTTITLNLLVGYYELNCFFHESDPVTLTSKRFLWTYPGGPLHSRSICVMPERLDPELSMITSYCEPDCHGICTDHPIDIAQLFSK